jgi:dihydroorotase-like cyclic amidohydrolase
VRICWLSNSYYRCFYCIWSGTYTGCKAKELWVEKVATHPRKLFNLPKISIQKGCDANFTIFDTASEWVVANKDIQSKSKNTSLIGTKLKGRVLGVMNNGQIERQTVRVL